MKQVNFSHSGGFPLEQETLEKLQTAYRSELFAALKSHLSIEKNTNYIVAYASDEKIGWAIIHQNETDVSGEPEGILYPIQKANKTGYLKTTRTGTNLIYGTGTSQTAYYDYDAVYISQSEFNNGVSQNSDALTVNYYDLSTFKVIQNIQTIENTLNSIEADINLINQTYLPLDGSKAMTGDLDLDIYQLSKLDIKESNVAKVRVADFLLGSTARRGLLHEDALGRAMVDNSDSLVTKLTLNYESDWSQTHIGGKVHFDNLNTTGSTGSLLVIDNSNQVTKSNSLPELLNRITVLESKIATATALPIGMIAIWGKPAPFPDGWAEYIPLRGKMPVGLYNPTPQERSDLQDGDGGNGITYYIDANGSAVFPFDTIGLTSGRIGKKLRIEEMPSHNHTFQRTNSDSTGTGNQYVTTGDGDEGPGTGGMLPAGGGQQFSILNPYRVVQFIEYIGGQGDNSAPTTPINVSASNITTTSLTLSWTASSDNTAVNNYLISINGTAPFSAGNVLSYNVGGLFPDTSYSFTIAAQDAAGNTSIASAPLIANTNASVPTSPTLPTYINARFTGVNRILIDWNIEPNNVGNVIYQILTGDSYFGNYTPIDQTTESQYIDLNVIKYNTYYYKLRIINAAGEALSDFSQVLEVKANPDLEDE